VIFIAVLAVAAGAFGALGLPKLAVATPPDTWQLAAAEPQAPTPGKRHRCRHDERPAPAPFDFAR
jgi:hypothetical protein